MILNTQGVARRLMRITAGFFILGIALIVVSQTVPISSDLHERSWAQIGLRVELELGVALIVASVVAFIFERLLSRERLLEMSRLFGEQREMEEFGFKKIFGTRQMVFDELFESTIPNAKDHIKIMGICVSLFKEARRDPRPRTQRNAIRIRELLVELLERGCVIHVLYLKRYPDRDQLKKYGITDGDFFSMRERDEDEPINFLHGKRLKKIANASHADWIKVLLLLAERTKDSRRYKNEEARRELLKRLRIREYFAMPSVSLYIVDQDIYVTPYLYKKHCSDVPAFKVSTRESQLYKSYDAHFAASWDNSPFTSPAISEDFIDALAKDPHKTLELYKEKELEALMERQAIEVHDAAYIENPEYFRIEETAIKLTVTAALEQSQTPSATH